MRILRGLALPLAFVAGACGSSDGAAPQASRSRATPTTENVATTENVITSTTVDPWAVTPTEPLYQPTPVVLHAPAPVRIDIGRIEVGSDLVALGLQPDGSMEVPADFDRAGWFTGGPRPGENGPAVIAGHVDSRSGPAVFARLDELETGDEIAVTRDDGSRVTFQVGRVEQFPKDGFPTAAVFGPTAEGELRLVTCGGHFDRGRRSYRSNVVVFASLRTPANPARP